jgi:hypothetical protein
MNDADDRVDETMHHFRFDQGYDYETEIFVGELLNVDNSDINERCSS